MICKHLIGAPGGIRIPDPLVRSQVLYPAEPRALLEARYYLEGLYDSQVS